MIAGAQKEHALLESKALEWQQHREDAARLLNSKAVRQHRAWLDQAKLHSLVPAPTALQERYVHQSERRATHALRVLKVPAPSVLSSATLPRCSAGSALR